MHQELEQVRQRLVESGIDATETSASEITIHAVHKDVGDIVIRSEGGELIVCIGHQFHDHFAPDDDYREEADRLVEFLMDFVNDRIVLTIRYLGARAVTARVRNTETGQSSIIAFAAKRPSFLSRIVAPFAGRQETSRSFKWSGPLSDGDSPELEEGDDASGLAAKLAGLNADEMKGLADYLSQQLQESSEEPE